MQGYGRVFAKVYNLLWSDFADHIAPQVHDFYAATKAGQHRQPVLDLCCGTGRLSRFFLERDYRVMGLDLSEHMITYALENNLEYVVVLFLHNMNIVPCFFIVGSIYKLLNNPLDIAL